nr:DUF202 domain-containing protein [Niabella ginsenosidivorans]
MEANKNSKAGASDHLANERTFLAWIRTSIGIMGFGFVVVKFSLFIRQLALALDAPQALPPVQAFPRLLALYWSPWAASLLFLPITGTGEPKSCWIQAASASLTGCLR